MINYNESGISIHSPTLNLKGIRAYFMQICFISAAVAAPAIAHLINAPVNYILPMHWPIIFAGLVYGWRGGAVCGLFAPVASFMVSGMPPPVILPFMTIEMIIYGTVTGLLRENFGVNRYISVAIALVLGRMVYALSLIIFNFTSMFDLGYFIAIFSPGIIAAICQVIFLPKLADFWIKHENKYLKE